MLIFSALFSAWAALAAPDQPIEELLEDGIASEEGEVSEFDFTDETDPSEGSRWECYDDDDFKKRGYCLARCEDQKGYRAVTDKIKIRGNRDFCERRARRFCKKRGDHVRNWCFGERDKDDHDNDDNDDNDNHD